MKKWLYTGLLFLLLKLPLCAQTTYWSEDFNPGQNWFTESNWTIYDGDMRFEWTPLITDFDCSSLSPVISLGDDVYELHLNQYLEPYEFMVTTEKAEISIVSGGEETVIWSYDLIDGIWGEMNGSPITFDLNAFIDQDIQIKFRTFGPTTDAWYYWDIFDVSISAILDNDMSLTSVTGPVSVDVAQTGTWTVTVKNNGSLPESDFTVKLFSWKTGELIASISDPDILGPFGTKSYDFDWTPSVTQNTVLYGVVVLEGDQFESNNSSKGFFVRVSPDLPASILIWDNDNNIPTIIDPEQGELITPSVALKHALDAAGLAYDFTNYLPDSLYNYDMIFCTMGCYCVD